MAFLDIVTGVGKGIGQGVVSLVEGVGDLVVAGAKLSSDPVAQAEFGMKVIDLTKAATAYKMSFDQNPARVIDDAQNLYGKAVKAYNDARDAARAQGISDAEFNSTLAGRGIFEVGMMFVGVGEVEAASDAAKLAKATELAVDADKIAQKSKLIAECPLNVAVRSIAKIISPAEAEALLVKAGLSSERAADFVASFEGPITIRTVEPGESFLRYTDYPNSSGSFLTKSTFASSGEAADALYLEPYGNKATYVQTVTAKSETVVLEGGVKNGREGVQQTLLPDKSAFEFGEGK